MWLLWGLEMNKMKHWCTRVPCWVKNRNSKRACAALWISSQKLTSLLPTSVSFFCMVELTTETTEQNWPDQIQELGEEHSVLSGNVSNVGSASWLWGGRWLNACWEEVASSPEHIILLSLCSARLPSLSSVSLSSSSFPPCRQQKFTLEDLMMLLEDTHGHFLSISGLQASLWKIQVLLQGSAGAPPPEGSPPCLVPFRCFPLSSQVACCFLQLPALTPALPTPVFLCFKDRDRVFKVEVSSHWPQHSSRPRTVWASITLGS